MLDDMKRDGGNEHCIGQELNGLSVDELEKRINLSNQELERLQEALKIKKDFLSNAEGFCKKILKFDKYSA